MSDRAPAGVRFELLGPLRAWHGDTAAPLGTQQQQVVLSVLLLHANRPVSRDGVVHAVWGPDAPAYAINLLQKHVSCLRKTLRAAGLVVWTGTGYRINVPDDDLDLAIFEREVRRARDARADGDLAAAAAGLRAALDLWRGAPFDGLNSPLLEAERDRLEERRISVLEESYQAELELGHDADLIAGLRAAVARHPLRERLRGLLMLALYRSGRQAEALVTFQQGRRHLHDELGINPAPPLQQLHQQILTADPVLSAPGLPAPAGVDDRPDAQSPPVPAQLPHSLPHFAGRAGELDRLDALLHDEPAARIIAITGTAGVGKTALAVHWAARARHHFPDGQLYVNLRGFDGSAPSVDAADVIRGFLEALAVRVHRIPVSLDAQAALYRSLLADRRMLIVLDNAHDAAQVRPLLPGAPGCLVVITSRNQLTGLVAVEGAHPVVLDLLTATDAQQLLSQRLGKQRVAAEPDAVDDLIASCARLPLALTVVAARAATRASFPLAVLAAELREQRALLDALAVEDTAGDVRAVFSWSYRRLSPEAARLFRLLGLHAGPDIGTSAAARLAGADHAQTRLALTELTRAHLVYEWLPGRFTFHDLLRAYAVERAELKDTADDREAAVRRALDYYAHTAVAADRLLNPHRDPSTPAPLMSAADTEPLGGPATALAWFVAEQAVLLAAVEQAADGGFDAHAQHLAWGLGTYLHRRGLWFDLAGTQRAALHSARRRADRTGQALANRALARAYTWLGRYDDAHRHYREALDLFGELGDPVGQAHIHHALARLFGRQGRPELALEQARRALRLHQAAGHLPGEADALNAVGWFHAQLGDHHRALGYCHRALTLHRQIGHHEGEEHTWDSLGYAHSRLGHHDAAIESYRNAINLSRGLGDRYNEADALSHLGDAYQAAGDVGTACDAWEGALRILDEVGHPDADEVRNKRTELRRHIA